MDFLKNSVTADPDEEGSFIIRKRNKKLENLNMIGDKIGDGIISRRDSIVNRKDSYKDKCKKYFQKLSNLSIAQKKTGGLYFNGKDRYSSCSETLASLFVITFLFTMMLSYYGALNGIEGVDVTKIINLKEFKETTCGSMAALLSGQNHVRAIELPNRKQHQFDNLTTPVPIGLFPLTLFITPSCNVLTNNNELLVEIRNESNVVLNKTL